MKKITLLLGLSLCMSLIFSGTAFAQQPQTQVETLQSDVDGEGEGTFHDESSNSVFTDQDALLDGTWNSADPITKVRFAMFLGVVHRRVRDYPSLWDMVKYYSNNCYDDMGAISTADNYIRHRTICYLKAKGTFTNTYSQGIQPFSNFNRGAAAIYYSRSGRYLSPLPSASGTWHSSIEGCDVFTDVGCNSSYNNGTGELYQNGITSGCGSRKYCPGSVFLYSVASTWSDRVIADLD